MKNNENLKKKNSGEYVNTNIANTIFEPGTHQTRIIQRGTTRNESKSSRVRRSI